MKKMKKLFAVLLALAMVMGMSLTSFAANEATITVTGVENANELKFVQVIVPDTAEVTGWDFVNEDIAAIYIEKLEASDAQAAITKLIKYEANEEGAATVEQIAAALDGVAKFAVTDMANPLTVDKAGVYVITAKETGYTYKTMAAYVGFGEVTEIEIVDGEEKVVTHSYPALVDALVAAKKVPTDVTLDKDTVTDKDYAVSMGEEVEFKITVVFPYFDKTETGHRFVVYDKIEGANYLCGEADENGVATFEGATVYIGEENVTSKVDFVLIDKANGFSIDFSDLIDADNTYANETVTIKYFATVDAFEVSNEAYTNISDKTKDSVSLFTGAITLTKHDFANTNVTLAGAGFEVTKDEEVLTFTKVEDGVYTYDKNGSEREVFTGEDGTVLINGLDVGTYSFEEKTAPKGYSINEQPATATLSVEGKATAVFTTTTSMADTKLSALPSTGGIGTTIFTIGGCVIMIAAAYMFFVSNKKED